LSQNIAVGVIIAANEGITISACNFCTADPQAVLPDYLSIMQAFPSLRTRVGVIVVIALLTCPKSDCICGAPGPPGAPPEEILTIVRPRVDHCAVILPLVGPPPCVAG